MRGIDPELEQSLRELAARDGSSLDKAALKLMRRGAGLKAVPSTSPGIGGRLKQFAGQLTESEAEAIDQAIREARQDDITLQQ